MKERLPQQEKRQLIPEFIEYSETASIDVVEEEELKEKLTRDYKFPEHGLNEKEINVFTSYVRDLNFAEDDLRDKSILDFFWGGAGLAISNQH